MACERSQAFPMFVGVKFEVDASKKNVKIREYKTTIVRIVGGTL